MFIKTFNSSVSMEFTDAYWPHAEQLRRSLGRLDGVDDFAYLMYCVPDDAGWPDAPGYDDAEYSAEYMQSAGSASGMVIEMRRVEADGRFHHYTVGRPAGDPTPVTLTFAGHTLTVPASEVFTADEAAPIYLHYVQHRTVPDDVMLRELRFDAAP